MRSSVRYALHGVSRNSESTWLTVFLGCVFTSWRRACHAATSGPSATAGRRSHGPVSGPGTAANAQRHRPAIWHGNRGLAAASTNARVWILAIAVIALSGPKQTVFCWLPRPLDRHR